jgi:phosphate transport system substrate-binding protein
VHADLGRHPAIPDHGPVLRIRVPTPSARHSARRWSKVVARTGLLKVHSEAPDKANEQRIVGETAQGRRVEVEVAAHGSSTGFSALKTASADLASSRPIKDSELVDLRSLGDLKSAAAEQVIAIDGLAIILHPQNPLNQLDTEQLARLFSGEVKTWEEPRRAWRAIHLYARDDHSGTYDTFKELVLSRRGKTLSGPAKRFESSEQLSDAVSLDPQGIGFIGLPYVRQAKPWRSSTANRSHAAAQQPDRHRRLSLSRRLFLYLPPRKNPWADALVAFAQSSQGQAIVAANGFIAQTVQAMTVTQRTDARGLPGLSRHAQRLTVNFRFEEGSASLDNKARQDLSRVLDYIKQRGKTDRQVTLVGFGDAKSDPARADLLSKLRAMAVRRELVKSGVVLRDVRGFGAEMPVAANSADEGRIKNRRVEVWVY